MARPCRARRGALAPAVIERVASLLLDVAPATAGALVGIRPVDADGFELAVKPASASGPLHDLLGWRAPPDWAALVVVSGAEVADHHAGRERGTVALVVTRAGGQSAFLRRDDGPPEELDPGHGRVLDACRRALGLGTAPPRATVQDMWVVRWLDHLVEALASGEEVGPAEATALHPLAELLGPGDDLASLAWSHLARASWADLRWLAAQRDRAADEPDEELLTAALARWMDDGMVQRWLMDALPGRGELLAALADLASPAVLALVEQVLAAWAEAAPPMPERGG